MLTELRTNVDDVSVGVTLVSFTLSLDLRGLGLLVMIAPLSGLASRRDLRFPGFRFGRDFEKRNSIRLRLNWEALSRVKLGQDSRLWTVIGISSTACPPSDSSLC